jgi:hypothetical protein
MREKYEGAVLFVVLSLLIATLGTLVVGRVRDGIDTWRYGYPRTMHLSGVVEHGDSTENPTRFIAVNADRVPAVIEFPAGNVDDARVLVLPRLFGARADRVPIVLSLVHAAGDTGIDLVVDVAGEQVLYVNQEGAFRLATDAERAEWRDGRGDAK